MPSAARLLYTKKEGLGHIGALLTAVALIPALPCGAYAAQCLQLVSEIGDFAELGPIGVTGVVMPCAVIVAAAAYLEPYIAACNRMLGNVACFSGSTITSAFLNAKGEIAVERADLAACTVGRVGGVYVLRGPIGRTSAIQGKGQANSCFLSRYLNTPDCDLSWRQGTMLLIDWFDGDIG